MNPHHWTRTFAIQAQRAITKDFVSQKEEESKKSFKSAKKKKKIPIYFRFPIHQKAFTRIFVRISISIQVYSQESSRLLFKSSSKIPDRKQTVNQSESFKEMKKIQNETLIWKSLEDSPFVFKYEFKFVIRRENRTC
jgi:hypothetical protein